MTENPAHGGSYIRDPHTGALRPSGEPAPEPIASDPAAGAEDAPETTPTPDDDAPTRRKRG